MRRQTSGDFYDADAEPENDNLNNNKMNAYHYG